MSLSQEFLNTLYPQISLTTTEMVEIAEALDKTSVKKYLYGLARESISALANGTPKPGETADAYLQREAIVKGQLNTIQALLTIEKAPSA